MNDTDQTVRAFIGLPVKNELALAIEQMIPEIQLPSDVELRLSPRENWHVTLHFFGKASPKYKLEQAWHELAHVLQRSSSCQVKPISIVGLPMYHSQAWVLVLEPTDSLLSLQLHVCAKLNELGFAIEERPYFPHITLWRPKGNSKVDLPQLDVNLKEATIDEVALYESQLHSEGSRYHILKSSQLR